VHVIPVVYRKEGQKNACVVRYGAWGDAVLITPVLRQLAEDGYHVTLNCTERVYEILQYSPYVHRIVFQATNEIPAEKLVEYWDQLSKQFDRFINLSGSIENALLKAPPQEEYLWPKERRHEVCNKNYMDYTMEVAGYPEKKGLIPELHFKKGEEKWAKKLRKKHKGFLVVVSMSGSSPHKIYPWMGDVVNAITSAIPNSHVMLVGEGGCRGIIDETGQITDLCGQLDIRRTFCLLKYADLVISTETSVANAASAFETPKVIILSHSSEENLTKYWKNCEAVFQPVGCYPCHKLHYTKKTCELDTELEMPACAALLAPTKVLDVVQRIYENYLQKKEEARSAVTTEHLKATN
jgi:ADP-heptose:LPS heptosyltransferase